MVSAKLHVIEDPYLIMQLYFHTVICSFEQQEQVLC